MVETRQQKHDREDRSEKEGQEQPKRQRTKEQAKCESNQPLVEALHELAGAIFRAQSLDPKNRFKAIAVQKGAHAIADLDYEVVNGQKLAEGDGKVQGIGSGIANYIDEFVETGMIYDIGKYDQDVRSKKAKGGEKKASSTSAAVDKELASGSHDSEPALNEEGHADKEAKDTKDTPQDIVEINRAPVLTLWVVVVAQKEGYSRAEACTYGRWIAGTFAHTKGQSLGIFEEDSEEKREARRLANEESGVTRVEVFVRVKIPVIEWNGDRLAAKEGKPMDPKSVEGYLQRSFGDKLKDVEAAMQTLADSMTTEDLNKKAYSLYEEFRPDWKGWGKKSTLRLSKIRQLVRK